MVRALSHSPCSRYAARTVFHKVVPVTLILASSSAIRRDMLAAAGVSFEVLPSDVDDSALKVTLRGDQVAAALAAAKALNVSAARAGDWVIGSDSVVRVDGRSFDKARSRNEAAEHLRFFSGKAMLLTSAVALAKDGKAAWAHAETARLQVRPLSEEFIESYLQVEWPEVGYTVGVFRLEGPGVQLFNRIEGDHFTVLGMPLIPLLGALRERR